MMARPRMSRTSLLSWGLVLTGALLCTLLTLFVLPRALVLPWFFFMTVSVLVVPLRQGALALALTILGMTVLLWTRHHYAPSLPPVSPAIIAQTDAWIGGTGLLVLLLAERSRRLVQSAARARENLLPWPGAGPGTGHLYARLLDQSPDAVVVVDSGGRIAFFSQEAETLFGYSRDEVLGESVELLLPPELRERHVQHRTGFLATPRRRAMGTGLELRARRHDGSEVPIEVALAPVESEQGGHHSLIVKAAIRDIRPRKEAEEALIQERVRREGAEQAVAERDLFASLSSHELKTPLTSIRGYAQLLVEAVHSADTMVREGALHAMILPPDYMRLRQQAAHAIAAIDRQSIKMSALVERMLDISRLGQGTFSLQKKEADLRVVVREVVGSLRASYPDRTLALVELASWDGGPKPPLVFAFDALRLEQVLTNLCTNALNFSADEVVVRLWRESTAGTAEGTEGAEGTAGPGEEWAVLTVADRGPGIPPADRDRVFQKFVQLGGSDRGVGLGLGLFLSKELVAAHGGTITISDTHGGGTTITVRLPLQAQEDQGQQAQGR